MLITEISLLQNAVERHKRCKLSLIHISVEKDVKGINTVLFVSIPLKVKSPGQLF
ncbi:uncharacterized protein PHALS_01179 [Plasmopara halstedii]|uniref:Uncharacterized protein n=1 Tax=Plasmopara halstedii TaxID=4781 RepID=A0A0P1ASG5_PLAHL|nr:uncharacterized protein PHALS_01179 [Plasmopara halstedii]CEG44847.1 hypothetical protein PHALS_01179 [Plasmopara halstedii]|eukprot:XP_024581216.1 hypothetical protein PHALS_01179 [Plasmopara halstedii]